MMERVEIEADVRRWIALILMKYNDYDGAKKKLIEAQTSYPGIEYVDELIKLCDIACTAKSQGSGIDWYSVLDTKNTANVSDIEFKYTELMRTLEPVKNKFPEIQSALGLIKKAYSEFDSRRAASLVPCGSVNPLDIVHSETVNIDSGATSQSSSGTKRIVSEDSDNNSLICNTGEQPFKRVRSLGGNDCEAGSDTAESKSRLNEEPNPEPLSIPEDVVMDTVAAEFSNGASIKHQNFGSPLITSVPNPEIYTVNQCAVDVALKDQIVKKFITYSRQRHLSPKTCEERTSQADGKSKDDLEMDRSSRENVGKLTAKNSKEKVAEEIDIGVTLGGFTVNVSGYGSIVSHSDDAANKLVDKEKVAEEIDTESDCVMLGGDDFELLAETQSLNKLTGTVCGQQVLSDTAKRNTRLNKVEGFLGTSSGSLVKTMVHKECTLIYHDFNNHKRAGVFAVGQFLAVYDQEKMPRLYAQINRIETCYKTETNCTEYAFYLRWLRPAPVNADERKWHDAGLPVSCGLFKLDSDKIGKCDTVIFSHLVSSLQEYRVLAGYSKEMFELYPRKGEVWAIYKDWKPLDWCLDPKTRIGCKFQLVEILSNYSTRDGIKVAPVVKVAGYKTIFQWHGLCCQIAARNLFRFSHNVPVRFAGYKRDLLPGRILDLDPLSIPDDVSVDAVAEEFSNGFSIKHQTSGFPRTSSVPNPEINTGNQYTGYVAPRNQNVKQCNKTSRLRLLSPRSCEVHKSQAAGTSKGGSTSLNEVETSLGRSSWSAVKSTVQKEPTLEFHDFSSYEKACSFTVGQFLAVYDQEKMPRSYAKITRIEHCFKKETNSTEYALYVRWLRPAPVNLDEKKWHEAGLPVSCGIFKLNSNKVHKCDAVVFSHLVLFQEYGISKELVELYPRAGEVWALYKDWKPFDWCSDPKTRKGCKFQLVEILSDYSTAAGVKVGSLARVAGHRTIFRRSGLSYQIAASKLFGFSHNIPVRCAGNMKGLFSGMVLDLDRLSIPKEVIVDIVAAEFSNHSSSIMHQNSQMQ
ncbi:uncharacterized protein LOC113328367 [Papaver somniferum]|uniref:uncharacterized protein LOC113328367 n=1 Tax=Papaver somniferum TaxID=3469 RepID=UPI000E7015BF|nr:uncharacterized protein LOC113328367 [Papaver somniferum]